jgi:hypothetical protein
MGPVVFLLVPTRYQINHDMNQAKEQGKMRIYSTTSVILELR